MEESDWVSPEFLVPLPKVLWGTACEVCEKLQSRWVFRYSGHVVCSTCYLRHSTWAHVHTAEVLRLIAEVECQLRVSFRKDGYGYLVEVEDCDRFLMAIASSARVGLNSATI